MIIGTGDDIVEIDRIGRLVARFGARFTDRIFTQEEMARAAQRQPGGTHIATLAKRFAAKEACSKALGTGISGGIGFRDIGVINDDLGKPHIVLKNAALDRLNALLPKGHEAMIHVSLSDEPPYAKASVIIEAVAR